MTDKKKWLLVLGLRAGYDIPAAAKNFLRNADTVIGGARNLSLIPSLTPSTIKPLMRPFAKNIDWLKKMKSQGKKIAFVATGDPSFFGAAKILRQHFNYDEMLVVPAVSVVSLVAAAMGWAVEDAIIISTHGDAATRPIEQLVRHLHPHVKIIVIARDAPQLLAIAQLLQERNFGDSRLTIFSNLGGDDKKTIRLKASAIKTARPFEMDFYTIAIEAIADKNTNAPQVMTTAGHEIDFFHHDGQITKPETRAIILSKLRPAPQKLLWDIGAGAGSVAVEWALRGGRALTIETKKNRHDNILKNIARFGLQNNITALNIPAQQFLRNYLASGQKKSQASMAPDIIFVGGGVSDNELMAMVWRALPHGGRLVSASHSVEGQMAQHAHHQTWGGEVMTINIAQKKAMTSSDNFHTMAANQQTTLHVVDKK